MEPEKAPQAAAEVKQIKTKVGRVVGDKMEKTIVVAVESQRRHAVYNKLVRHTRTFKVHDETKQAHVGDTVRIVESKPFSKQKRWRLDVILQRGEEIKVEA